MRLIAAVGLLCGLVAIAVVTRSAAAYYLASAAFVVGLLMRLIRVRRW